MREGKPVKFNDQLQQQNGHISPFKFAKLLDPEASWDKDQLGDVLHWIRQVAALVCGLLWGAVPFIGAIWIIVFLALSSGIIYGYYSIILKIDEEDFGGHGALLQEGLFASLTLFLIALFLSSLLMVVLTLISGSSGWDVVLLSSAGVVHLFSGYTYCVSTAGLEA